MDGQGKRGTFYIGETEQWHHQPLYMASLEFLRREGGAGATVERGAAGFGVNSRIKTASLLDLSIDLPVVVTRVDRPDRVERVLPELAQIVPSGLITIEAVQGYHNQTQYTVLVTVVILSAVVPTLIAQAFFLPTQEAAERRRTRQAPLRASVTVIDRGYRGQQKGE